MSEYLPPPRNYTPINGVCFYPAPQSKCPYADYVQWLRTLSNQTLKTLSDPEHAHLIEGEVETP
jgi:hypothetical protein